MSAIAQFEGLWGLKPSMALSTLACGPTGHSGVKLMDDEMCRAVIVGLFLSANLTGKQHTEGY